MGTRGSYLAFDFQTKLPFDLLGLFQPLSSFLHSFGEVVHFDGLLFTCTSPGTYTTKSYLSTL